MLMIAFEIRRLGLGTWVGGLAQGGARRFSSGAAVVAGLVSLSPFGCDLGVGAIACADKILVDAVKVGL